MKILFRHTLVAGAALAFGIASAQDDTGAETSARDDLVKPAEGVERALGIQAFHTYSQRAWGVPCDGDTAAACLLETNFEKLFPMGLVIGDADGLDTDEEHALVFDSAEALDAFLPIAEDVDVTSLQQSLTNPAATERGLGGALTGELIAAKLNVVFDYRGLMPTTMTGVHLADLTFVGGVADPLLGSSVKEVVRLADSALAGLYGPFTNSAAVTSKTIDIDEDGTPDTSIHDVHVALTLLNGNFANGKANAGHLAPPARDLADKLDKSRRIAGETADADEDGDDDR